jgi:uncharacterized membrane protein YhaH (DUF805 family)
MTFFLAPSGTLSRGRFLPAVLAVYAAGFASQMLTAPVVLEKLGLWPFAAIQLLLLWCWYVVHARRLRDAGRSAGLAMGIAIIYLLALVLMLMVLAFTMPEGKTDDTVPLSSIVGLYLLLWIFGVFGDRPSLGVVEIYAFALLAVAAMPFVLVVGCSLYAGLRRSVPAASAQPSLPT